jgi:hypothetical protein
LRLGNSRNSFQKRFARASNHCAGAGRGRSYEANEVFYDPTKVDLAAMEEELRRAGTYLKTLER